jgi:hypothetical protein
MRCAFGAQAIVFAIRFNCRQGVFDRELDPHNNESTIQFFGLPEVALKAYIAAGVIKPTLKNRKD